MWATNLYGNYSHTMSAEQKQYNVNLPKVSYTGITVCIEV